MEKLLELLALPGVSGDESTVADYVAREAAAIANVTVTRIGDNVLALRGAAPRVAVFAHTDIVGWTLGYDRHLIPVGGPDGKDKDVLRCGSLRGRLRTSGKNKETTLRRVRNAEGKKAQPVPGSRWRYDASPNVEKGVLTSPYLDDRAGVWATLRVLERVENVVVAFCTGEEQHGHGARVCADYLYENARHHAGLDCRHHMAHRRHALRQRRGRIAAGRFCPRQAFLDRVVALSEESGVMYQKEIQSAGSSDGGHILRSSVPMDWVFVGAPEKRPHTSREQVELSDLDAMVDLLAILASRL